jgi:hypothetical protein
LRSQKRYLQKHDVLIWDTNGSFSILRVRVLGIKIFKKYSFLNIQIQIRHWAWHDDDTYIDDEGFCP